MCLYISSVLNINKVNINISGFCNCLQDEVEKFRLCFDIVYSSVMCEKILCVCTQLSWSFSIIEFSCLCNFGSGLSN